MLMIKIFTTLGVSSVGLYTLINKRYNNDVSLKTVDICQDIAK